MSTASAVPPEYHGLVDDAAMFPPGNAPLPAAVTAHEVHRAAPYAPLVGPFVVSDVRLPDLIETIRSGEVGTAPLAVSVVVSGGAGALEPAARWAGRAGELNLRGLEIALRDSDDLAHNARRVTTAVDQLLAAGDLAEDVAVCVEPPRLHGGQPGHGWLAALDEVAAMDHRLKFRLGGVTADAFPDPVEVAACIQAALDREVRFKCTAGLHRAVRHHDDDLDVDRHGFLNVLLATRLSLDGASVEDVTRTLAATDRADIVGQVRETGSDGLVSARRWFTSFGCCDVGDPVADLVALDLTPSLPEEPR